MCMVIQCPHHSVTARSVIILKQPGPLQDFCNVLDMELVTIFSEAEKNFISCIIRRKKAHVWIGAESTKVDALNKTLWRWSSGVIQWEWNNNGASVYQDWYRSQPPIQQESCAAMSWLSGSWFDDNCNLMDLDDPWRNNNPLCKA